MYTAEAVLIHIVFDSHETNVRECVHGVIAKINETENIRINIAVQFPQCSKQSIKRRFGEAKSATNSVGSGRDSVFFFFPPSWMCRLISPRHLYKARCCACYAKPRSSRFEK